MKHIDKNSDFPYALWPVAVIDMLKLGVSLLKIKHTKTQPATKAHVFKPHGVFVAVPLGEALYHDFLC